MLKKTITKVNQLIGPRSYACNGPQRTKKKKKKKTLIKYVQKKKKKREEIY